MARILAIKAGEEEGTLWCKVQVPGPQGEMVILTKVELEALKAGARYAFFEEIEKLARK